MKNKSGWTWADWLVAAGLYHTLDPTPKDVQAIERYQKLTKAWENCENPYRYKE